VDIPFLERNFMGQIVGIAENNKKSIFFQKVLAFFNEIRYNTFC